MASKKYTVLKIKCLFTIVLQQPTIHFGTALTIITNQPPQYLRITLYIHLEEKEATVFSIHHKLKKKCI